MLFMLHCSCCSFVDRVEYIPGSLFINAEMDDTETIEIVCDDWCIKVCKYLCVLLMYIPEPARVLYNRHLSSHTQVSSQSDQVLSEDLTFTCGCFFQVFLIWSIFP